MAQSAESAQQSIERLKREHEDELARVRQEAETKVQTAVAEVEKRYRDEIRRLRRSAKGQADQSADLASGLFAAAEPASAAKPAEAYPPLAEPVRSIAASTAKPAPVLSAPLPKKPAPTPSPTPQAPVRAKSVLSVPRPRIRIPWQVWRTLAIAALVVVLAVLGIRSCRHRHDVGGETPPAAPAVAAPVTSTLVAPPEPYLD